MWLHRARIVASYSVPRELPPSLLRHPSCHPLAWPCGRSARSRFDTVSRSSLQARGSALVARSLSSHAPRVTPRARRTSRGPALSEAKGLTRGRFPDTRHASRITHHGRTIPPACDDAGWGKKKNTNCQRTGPAALTLLALVRLSPAASVLRSNKVPHALRRACELRATSDELRATSHEPKNRFAVLQGSRLVARRSRLSLPGFSHPGGAASWALIRGCLRRPPSASRTTEQGPLSGPGLLPRTIDLPRRRSTSPQRRDKSNQPPIPHYMIQAGSESLLLSSDSGRGRRK